MIRLEIFSDLIRDVLLSGKIKDELPLSLILVAPPEHGKSELLTLFLANKNVSWCNDLSSNPLITKILPGIEKKTVTHIVIPDFLKILSHGKKTTQSLITNLNSLTAEGIKVINFYGVEREFSYPLKAGIVIAITKEAFERRKIYWREFGFLSRCLPCSFRYSDDTTKRINEFIRLGKYSHDSQIHVSQARRHIEIDSELSKIIEDLQEKYRPKVESYTGFRLHKQFRTLLKAIAYNDKKADHTHLEKLIKYLEWINFDFNLV